ncbi:DsbA family protein [Xanthomonas pisi]|uniref:DsbA family protein n=1 Tax=Xanthomonas pisi TaxID=56457 RepID=A0A2S7CUK6_9XANT|nr:DsbA family protein [Xanthomonas pisi]KLD71367.1 protein-disulfide isomerase [Xanthomonas pisi DSM 18956]PPU65275.1 DsbA family protein [Xanthomonas pisi]
MNTTLHYLFDPLCGWCYGAAATMSALAAEPGIAIELQPSGLFAGTGARAMDEQFASFAWANDQRIAQLTGQRFTERYRQEVLGDRQQCFDSGAATLALTAVSLVAPARQLKTLTAIQQARYVAGKDVTTTAGLVRLLEELHLADAATRLAQADAQLLSANRTRIEGTQALMREFGAQGVPTFIAESGGKRWLIDAHAAYTDPGAFKRQLQAA